MPREKEIAAMVVQTGGSTPVSSGAAFVDTGEVAVLSVVLKPLLRGDGARPPPEPRVWVRGCGAGEQDKLHQPEENAGCPRAHSSVHGRPAKMSPVSSPTHGF